MIIADSRQNQSHGRELISQMAGVANGQKNPLNAMIAFVRGLALSDAPAD
jgi:hypothetical protein